MLKRSGTKRTLPGVDCLQASAYPTVRSSRRRSAARSGSPSRICSITPLVVERPEMSQGNFLRDFGERFVPGYKAVSTVDLLMSAPFDE